MPPNTFPEQIPAPFEAIRRKLGTRRNAGEQVSQPHENKPTPSPECRPDLAAVEDITAVGYEYMNGALIGNILTFTIHSNQAYTDNSSGTPVHAVLAGTEVVTLQKQ